MASETFGIDVEIKTEKTEAGLKKVDKALEHTEATARKAGDAASKALAEGMERASRAVDDFEKDALAAFGAVEKSIQRAAKEEKEWEAAIKKSKDALAEATDKGIKAYDDALKASNVTMEKSTSVAKQLVGGWKEIVRGIGDVGNAINAVKHGVELVKSAFETSEKAARAAIAAWRAIDDSGPSAGLNRGTVMSTRQRRVYGHPEQFGLQPGWDAPGGTADQISAVSRINTLIETYHGLNQDFDDEVKAVAKEIARADADLKRQREDREARDRARGPSLSSVIGQQDRDAAAAAAKAKEDARARAAAGYDIEQALGSVDVRGAWVPVDAIEPLIEQMFLQHQRDAMVFTRGSFSRPGDFTALDAGPSAADLVGSLGRRSFKGGGLGFAEKLASGQGLKQQTEDAIKFAEALQGPVGGAIDGLIDGLVKWDMSWKEWGQSALAEIEKVLAKLALLQLVQWGFGQYGGGSTVGQFLWGALGGGPKPGDSSARMAPGDPFGGAGGGTSGAVWREPVQRQAPQGGGGPATPVVNVKVVTVADMRAAALELLSSAEGERAVLNHVQTNSGKLTAGGRR